MGNSCECVRRQSSGDEAEDALLASLVAEGTTDGRPRGPPPPYQPQAPIYNYPLAAMSGERRAELVRRVTIIQSLPCISYEVRGDKDKKKEPRECAICMMEYCAGELIKLLPCMHYYHLRCIDDWLMRSLTCPSCMERVDAGLLTTLSSSYAGNRGGRSLGFGLRRRRRAPPTEGESPLMSGSSRSSSRSSSTSSSREHLTNGGQISWQGGPLSPSRQQQSPREVIPGTIFLPPIPTSPSTPSQVPLSQVPSSPPSSPPCSPRLPHVTIHTSSPPHNTHTSQTSPTNC